MDRLLNPLRTAIVSDGHAAQPIVVGSIYRLTSPPVCYCQSIDSLPPRLLSLAISIDTFSPRILMLAIYIDIFHSRLLSLVTSIDIFSSCLLPLAIYISFSSSLSTIAGHRPLCVYGRWCGQITTLSVNRRAVWT